MKNKATSLYVHIPFCNQICSYCNFIKMYHDDLIIEKYLDSLEKEIFCLDTLKTIYIGGGTPSSLNVNQLKRLLKMLDKLKKDDKYEYTFEANPESLSLEKIKLLKQFGVNRISLGIQTFDKKLTLLLKREHTFEIVKEVISNLNKEGITNYSFDFIYAIPFQNKEMILNDLELALSLNPKHLSFYSLLIEENTLLYIQNYQTLEDSIQREFYDFIYNYVTSKGFKRYEISNFALEGYESIHNLTYWKNEHYYAYGVSASSYLDNKRVTNTKSITDYLKGINEKEEEIIDEKNYFFEKIMLGLRLDEGINMKEFPFDFAKKYSKQIEDLKRRNLIKIEGNYLKATYLGSMLLHMVIEEFMD